MICDDVLMPCPFCGSEQLLFCNGEYHKSVYFIECARCSVRVEVPSFKAGRVINNRARLRDTWNSRSEEEFKNKNPGGLQDETD